MPTVPVKPPALGPGATIGIAAPASPVREELLARGEAALAGLGFRVRRAAHVLRRGRYTAGTVAERVADLHELLADPAVDAIFFARGGYGSPQLIPHLDPGLLRRRPKLLMGASDATALLLWSLRHGVACVHGPMPAREFQEGRVDLAGLRSLLAGELGAVGGEGVRSLHPGRASGPLTGGCLSLVTASLATPWEIETEGSVLFLEDAATKPYQIDRMLTQLAQARKLAGVAAVAFGEMPGCAQHEDQGYTLDEVLADLTRDLGVPVIAGLPCGHTSGLHLPLPFGVQVTVDAGLGRLIFEEPVVAAGAKGPLNRTGQ